MTTGAFIFSVVKGADTLLIGRFFGADSIGLYSRASALLNRPLEQFLYPISSVFVPTLSRVQAQPERYRRAFLQIYEALALASFFFAGVLFALSRPLTLVVLGPNWEKAAIIFAGFTVAALCAPPARAASWLFTSQGRGKDWLIAISVLSVMTLASFIAGLPFGPAGVAIVSSVVGLVIGMPVLFHFAGQHGPVTTIDLWIGCFRYLPVWIVTWGATRVTLIFLSSSPPFVQVIVCGLVGSIAGLLLILSLPPIRRTALELIEIVRAIVLRKVSSK